LAGSSQTDETAKLMRTQLNGTESDRETYLNISANLRTRTPLPPAEQSVRAEALPVPPRQ
jgi:hypothetical protein